MKTGMATAVFAAVLATTSAAADLPRYRLEPGMVLTYKGLSRSNYGAMIMTSETQTTVWVVGRNPDGSARVVVRQGRRNASAKEGVELKGMDKQPMEFSLARLDLFPDGRIAPDSEVGSGISPQTIFPQLPADEAEAKAGWTVREPNDPDERRCDQFQTEPGGWSFRTQSAGPENAIYESLSSSTVHFDAARGIVKRTETDHSQNYGFQTKGTATRELVSLETLEPEKLAAFANAADAYFAGEKAYVEARRGRERDPAKLESVLAEAKSALEKVRDATTEPTFRERLDARLKAHDSLVKYSVDGAKRLAEVIGKPAPDWKAVGLDGKEHALADYRGKVVVLDFWYRGCGWCIKAMPQMNAVAEHFAGQPVALLGMNTDPVEADAKLVADVMSLKYGTIRIDKDLPGKYGVHGFPTLIVIGPDGQVRDVHVGYSKNLQQTLTKSIEALLPH
ncbi:TlpA family protein disulfide reductase [Paludisphaera rhizosphaerae]|uniref:TlpA family protein disulfide reductase n=1 Tax=Paludisphaera rhizosphaerae TaxID=2711216 RepID=UPI0013ED4406|nr:TlpA disulfide reductase family protein [Paludisphaera rhizosphaerae]